ncbi:MAG: NUDIX domain-containing protein [Caldilineaceae bacterium]|nr:NUDIX domain-containing protein [Caldilineaceae bacterium]
MNWLLKSAYRLYQLSWRITRPTVVGVRTLLLQDNQLLLVRHTYQHHWYFPGGAVKRGESLVDAARREALEEAGVTITGDLVLLGMYWSMAEGKNDHIAVFVGTEFSVGNALDRWEIADCRWFPLQALPAEFSPACSRRLAEFQQGAGPYIVRRGAA